MQDILIEKEQLNAVRFSKNEVLENQDAQKERLAALNKAMVLGNSNQHVKAKITFITGNGEALSVYTTIWAVTEKHVSVKSNTLIPLHAIYEVGF